MTNETYANDTDGSIKERTETDSKLTRVSPSGGFQAALKPVPNPKLAGGMGVGR